MASKVYFLTLGGDYRRQEGLPCGNGRHEGTGILLQIRRDHLENSRSHSSSCKLLVIAKIYDFEKLSKF